MRRGSERGERQCLYIPTSSLICKRQVLVNWITSLVMQDLGAMCPRCTLDVAWFCPRWRPGLAATGTSDRCVPNAPMYIHLYIGLWKHTVHYTVYFERGIVYIVHSTLYSIHCTRVTIFNNTPIPKYTPIHLSNKPLLNKPPLNKPPPTTTHNHYHLLLSYTSR